MGAGGGRSAGGGRAAGGTLKGSCVPDRGVGSRHRVCSSTHRQPNPARVAALTYMQHMPCGIHRNVTSAEYAEGPRPNSLRPQSARKNIFAVIRSVVGCVARSTNVLHSVDRRSLKSSTWKNTARGNHIAKHRPLFVSLSLSLSLHPSSHCLHEQIVHQRAQSRLYQLSLSSTQLSASSL